MRSHRRRDSYSNAGRASFVLRPGPSSFLIRSIRLTIILLLAVGKHGIALSLQTPSPPPPTLPLPLTLALSLSNTSLLRHEKQSNRYKYGRLSFHNLHRTRLHLSSSHGNNDAINDSDNEYLNYDANVNDDENSSQNSNRFEVHEINDDPPSNSSDHPSSNFSASRFASTECWGQTPLLWRNAFLSESSLLRHHQHHH